MSARDDIRNKVSEGAGEDGRKGYAVGARWCRCMPEVSAGNILLKT